eukprot:6447153-Prymnesium_polylepis.2
MSQWPPSWPAPIMRPPLFHPEGPRLLTDRNVRLRPPPVPRRRDAGRLRIAFAPFAQRLGCRSIPPALLGALLPPPWLLSTAAARPLRFWPAPPCSPAPSPVGPSAALVVLGLEPPPSTSPLAAAASVLHVAFARASRLGRWRGGRKRWRQ